MSHVDLAFLDQRLHRGRQFQEPQEVGDAHARAPDGARDLLVRDMEFLDQALEAARLLDRVQVLALDVLDQPMPSAASSGPR